MAQFELLLSVFQLLQFQLKYLAYTYYQSATQSYLQASHLEHLTLYLLKIQEVCSCKANPKETPYHWLLKLVMWLKKKSQNFQV